MHRTAKKNKNKNKQKQSKKKKEQTNKDVVPLFKFYTVSIKQL